MKEVMLCWVNVRMDLKTLAAKGEKILRIDTLSEPGDPAVKLVGVYNDETDTITVKAVREVPVDNDLPNEVTIGIFGYEQEGGLTSIEGAEVYAEHFVPGTIVQVFNILKAHEDQF